jgi:hypothetical protein
MGQSGEAVGHGETALDNARFGGTRRAAKGERAWPNLNSRVLDCASGHQIVVRVQFPRRLVDAPLQVTSSAWLGIHCGMPSVRIGINGDAQFRLVESTADHVRKLNGVFFILAITLPLSTEPTKIVSTRPLVRRAGITHSEACTGNANRPA